MSIRCFEEAAQSDPAYAPAYAGLADTYLTLMDSGYLSPQKATAKARPIILKAVQLDETLAEAHVSLGHAALHDFDWTTAEREFLRALELNSSSATARYYYSNYLVSRARLDEAIAQAEEARRLDPVSPASYSNLASILWFAGQSERAIEQAQKTLEVNPNYSRGYEDLGRGYEQMGALGSAIDAFRKGVSLDKQAHGTLASLAYAYALAGKRKEATRILRQLRRTAKTTFVSAYTFALIFVGLGKKDEAFAWFGKAFDERSSALPFLGVNPRYVSLRGDPRFDKLLRRVGLS
jgi:tetratricopeptide (TPR) repeat protein